MAGAFDQPVLNLSDLVEPDEKSATFLVEKLKEDLTRLRAGSVEYNSCTGQIMFLDDQIAANAAIAVAHAAMGDGLKNFQVPGEGDCLMGSLSLAFSVQSNMPPRCNLLVRHDISEVLRRASASADEGDHFGELAISMVGQGQYECADEYVTLAAALTFNRDIVVHQETDTGLKTSLYTGSGAARLSARQCCMIATPAGLVCFLLAFRPGP